jgi:uncharacterized iron-regulated protein
MRAPRFWPLLPLLLPLACTSTTHVVATADDTEVSIDQVASDLAAADVVVLGEVHGSAAVHGLHFELLQRLYERRNDLVIATQMFERDVQPALNQYLGGLITEADFLAAARPWPNYERDYRPMVEFARLQHIPMLAANAPEAATTAVAAGGLQAVAGDPFCARAVTAPEDDYFETFVVAMGHGGDAPESVRWHYEAQCLADDTMAETVSDHLAERERAGARPLVVLLCGCLHADHGRGVVARIRGRASSRDVRVVSTELVADIDQPLYSAARSLAQYVVVAPGGSRFGSAAIAAAPPLVDPDAAQLADAGVPLELPPEFPREVPTAGEPGRAAWETGTVVEGAPAEASAIGEGAEAAAAREAAAREADARAAMAREAAQREADLQKAREAAAAPAVAVTPPLPRPETPSSRPPVRQPAPVNPEGLRPALGLQPDYAGAQQGVLVGDVRVGGAAEKAGIVVGDIIVMLGGLPVVDVESYMTALDAQSIGQSVPVRVRRGSAEVELQVVIGARPAR